MQQRLGQLGPQGGLMQQGLHHPAWGRPPGLRLVPELRPAQRQLVPELR